MVVPPAALVYQPVLDRLVRLLPYQRLGGLVQQAVAGGGRGLGQDAVAVQGEGTDVEEVEHLGSRENEREIHLAHLQAAGPVIERCCEGLKTEAYLISIAAGAPHVDRAEQTPST